MTLPGLVQFRLCKLSDKDLAEKVADKLKEMYDTGKIPSRYIPARPNEDFDLLVGELCVRFMEATEKARDQNSETDVAL